MTKILLVEDDRSLREIYGVRLLAEGYDIVSAGDGEEALAMAIKERPNLIISDVMMPKISGFDMLDILRSTTETRGIKVIMMTALSSEDQRKRGEQLGADRYLVKSQVGIEDVVKTVHEVLGDGNLTPEQRIANKQAPIVEVGVGNSPQNAQNPIQPQPLPSQEPSQQNVITQAPNFSTQPTNIVRPAPATQVSREIPNLSRDAVIQAPVRPVQSGLAQSMDLRPVQQPAPQPVPQFTQNAVQAPIQSFTPNIATQTPQQPVQPVMPQPVAPFSTDRPSGLGERVIQPIAQDFESEKREAEFEAQLNSVLGVAPQQPVQIPVSENPQPPFGAR